MSRGLFAERFSTRRLRGGRDEERDGSSYDEDLAITVTLDGTPFVEAAPISGINVLESLGGPELPNCRELATSSAMGFLTEVVAAATSAYDELALAAQSIVITPPNSLSAQSGQKTAASAGSSHIR
jgi:hypothetical protein